MESIQAIKISKLHDTAKNERDIILPVSLGSGILFFIGLLFSYFFLVPAALNFFISDYLLFLDPKPLDFAN